MLAWEIPAEDWERMTVKTAQFKPGTQELQILFSCVPNEWFLSEVARKYGPGSYRVQAGPGPYRQKNTTIHVSTHYARDAGYQAAPPMAASIPDPNQMMAARTAQQALTGPVGPLELAQMIQTAVDTAISRIQPAQTALDPSALLLKGFEMASMMMGKASETMKLVNAPAVETAPRGWADVLAENLPNVLDVLKTAMTARPQPIPPQPPPPAPTLANHAQPPTQPIGAAVPQFPEPPQACIPLLQIMRSNAWALRGPLQSPQEPADLAGQLAGLLGPEMDESIIATAAHVQQFGPAILGSADPEFATPKAAAVLIEWAKILQTETQQEGDEQ